MVVAHAHIGLPFRNIISLFHMPLFFMASGYCFKITYFSEKRKKFIYNKIKGIWWPYVKWMILFTLLHNLFFKINILNENYGPADCSFYLYSSDEILTRCKDALFLQSGHALLGGFWFLKSLFWGNIVFWGITLITNKILLNMDKIIRNRKFCLYQYRTILVGCCLLCISAFLSKQFRMFTVFQISSWDFHAAFFIWCGYAYSLVGKNCRFNVKITICAVFLSSLMVILFPGASMTKISLIYFFPFTINAIVCTLAIFGICCNLNNTKSTNKILQFIRFIGDNTLTILTWHFLSFKVVSIVLIYMYDLPIEQLSEYPVIRLFDGGYAWFFYSIAGISIPLVLAYINRYIPNKFLKL